MARIIHRNSVLAITKEVTEGTPLEPSAATDFIPIRAGMSIDPAFDTEQTDEVRSSIDAGDPIIVGENPKANVPTYLRHSGVEGTAPMNEDLLHSAFGAKTVNSTQRTTTTGSSVSSVVLGAGGSDFDRGMAILGKHASNAWEIRPVLSKSSNTLTLGFPMANALTTGAGVGKCVNFAPANSGHPSLSPFLYRGNGGALEVVGGMKVASMNIALVARKIMTMDFQLEGTDHYFNPIFITTAADTLDFHDGSADIVARVAAGIYKDPNSLASALQTAMNLGGSSDSFTVTYNSSGAAAGKFTIATNGSTLTLKFSTGTNTARTIATKIGFTVANESAATTYNSDAALSWAAGYTPTYDTAPPLAAKDNEVLFGSTTNTGITGVQQVNINYGNEILGFEDVTSQSGIDSKDVNGRKVKIDMVLGLDQHQVDYYTKFREGTNVPLCYNFGVKSGGNWVPGSCGNIYVPSGKLSKYNITESAGKAVLNLTLETYANATGQGSFYMNFL